MEAQVGEETSQRVKRSLAEKRHTEGERQATSRGVGCVTQEGSGLWRSPGLLIRSHSLREWGYLTQGYRPRFDPAGVTVSPTHIPSLK